MAQAETNNEHAGDDKGQPYNSNGAPNGSLASGDALENTFVSIDTYTNGIAEVVNTNNDHEIGTLKWFTYTNVQTQTSGEYLLANGQPISREDYKVLNDLYQDDGYIYGSGDGSTTFNLPNLMSSKRFIRASDVIGNVGTEEVDEIKSHSHSISPNPHSHRISINVNLSGGGSNNEPQGGHGLQSGIIENTSLSIGNSGGSETRPINMYLIPAIKVQ